MADFDPDAYLAGKQPTAVPPAGFDPDAYLKQKAVAADPSQFPTTPAQMREQQNAIRVREQVRRQKEDFISQNARPGVPIDVENGLPSGIRARLSMETDPAKQVDLLSKQPGILGARLASGSNNIIATVDDGKGGKRDVLLHPLNQSPTLGDVAGEAAPLTKAAVATGLAFGTGGMSLAGQGLAMGGGMALEHAMQLTNSRLEGGQSLDPGQIAKESAKEGAVNAALPLAGAAVGAGLRGARSLLTRGAGALEANVPEAARRLGVETLPSMDTGSKLLARSEAAAKLTSQNKVLAGGLKAAEDRQLSLSGPASVPSEQDVAAGVQPIAQKNALAAETGVANAKNAAANSAQDRIKATLDSGLTPSNIPQSEAGAYLRGKLAAFAGNVKAEAEKNYPAFYQKAAEEGITLDPKPVSDLVAKIAEVDKSGAAELLSPSIKQVKAVEGKLNPVVDEASDTGLVDQFGRKITTAGNPAEPLGFQEAINLRAIVRKKLNSPTDPLGDVVKRYYGKLDDALTQTIETGLRGGSPELRKAYDAARGSYSEGAQALEQGRLPKLFADAGDAGHIPDEKIVPSLFTGQGNLDGLRAWKSVLDPKDYKLLLRQGVNHLIESSGSAGGYINADTFLSKLSNLSPEVQAEVLGPVAKDITNNARLLASARGVKIDPIELQDALASTPGQAPRLLQQAIDREAMFDQQYNNGVAKALRGGNLGPSSLGNVDDFTSRWLSKAGSADARQAMTQISAADPAVAEQVRQRTLQNILNDSRASADLGQISTGGNPNIDPSKLAKYLTGAERDKYQVVLGKDGIQFLDDLATISEANAKRVAQSQGRPLTAEGLAERVGAIAGGNELTLMREGARKAYDLALSVPGQALKSQAVRDFLKTGTLPTLSTGIPRVAKALALAAPETIEQGDKIKREAPALLGVR